MTRVFLIAGVAALAIAAPADAGPHGGGGGHGGGSQPFVMHGGGGGGQQQRAERGPQMRAQRMPQMRAAAPQMRAQRMVERPQRMAERPQRAQRMEMRASRAQERMAVREQARGHAQQRAARQEMRANRMQAQNRQQMRAQQAQNHQQMRANRVEQMRANRMQQAQQMRANRMQQAQDRVAQRQQLRAERMNVVQNHLANNGSNNGVGYGVGGCPPGLASKGCMPPGQALAQGLRSMPLQNRVMTLRDMGDARFVPLDIAPRRNILAPAVASALVGVPLATASTFGTFSPLPNDFSYLYPATPNYYYQYGNGYVYQVDRGSNLIAALFPLLAGGFLPGSYLPQPYMSSYVPSYYGLNSFYPASYGYGGLCNRYGYGVVYQVDCATGFVENVIPVYAAGYGVGQMLPAAYSYYNLPMQYRSLYYPTADYSYWYSPGAIYQYDTNTSLITSVAALMAPGLTIGQPLPMGYGMYNVPMAYRATYYDTPNAWYRYNNGYIYQVDPSTMLVTAIVASLLT